MRLLLVLYQLQLVVVRPVLGFALRFVWVSASGMMFATRLAMGLVMSLAMGLAFPALIRVDGSAHLSR